MALIMLSDYLAVVLFPLETSLFKYGCDDCIKLLLTMLKSHIIPRAANEMHSHLFCGPLTHLAGTVIMTSTHGTSLISGNS